MILTILGRTNSQYNTFSKVMRTEEVTLIGVWTVYAYNIDF